MTKTIQIAHGGGGRLSSQLIDEEIVSRFGDGPLKNLPDAALLPNFRGKIMIVVYPIVTTIFASIVFYRYLYISLPKGIGFFQDISIYLLALIK